jgi:hypothetical protein
MERTEFVQQVIAEVENLKLNATEVEKAKLDRSSLRHYTAGGCIYGQLTGASFSERAHELSPKIYENATGKMKLFDTQYEDLDFSKGVWFTALEKYLYIITQEERIHILDYIKGDTETLNIK